MKKEPLYDKIWEWIIAFGPRILFAVVILIVGQWLIKMIKRWLGAMMTRRDFDHSLQPFFLSLAITALRIALVLGIMQILGIQMTIFAAVIGAAGVAAGLALSGTLQNFAGGVLILLLKPFEVGDNIIAQGQDGTVSSIQIFYTVIKTGDNRTVIIPNGKLFNEVIVNVTREGKRRLEITLKMGYSSDIDEIRELIADVVKKSDQVLMEPEPQISVSELQADGLVISIRIWTAAKDFSNTRFEINENIVRELHHIRAVLPDSPGLVTMAKASNDQPSA